MNKFEKLIEYIINDEDTKARALFHDIVVERSRDIYENIMADETVHGDEVEEMVDELENEEAQMEDEGEEDFSLDAEGDEEGELSGEINPEMGDDMDIGDHEDHEEHEEIEDKVMSIDSKIDELLAKFDEIMGDEGKDYEPADMDHEESEMDENMMEAEKCNECGMVECECDDKHDHMSESWEKEEESADPKKAKKDNKKNPFAKKEDKKEKTEEGRKSVSQLMREYVDTVGQIYGGEGDANEGTLVGTGNKSQKPNINTKDIVGPGNNFGGEPIKSKGGEQNQDGKTPTKANNYGTQGQAEQPLAKQNQNDLHHGRKVRDLNKTGVEYSKEHPSDGTAVGNDGKLSQNTKSVQKQNTGKK
jgi:hypothetical protein